jgi:hypothetical protein
VVKLRNEVRRLFLYNVGPSVAVTALFGRAHRRK